MAKRNTYNDKQQRSKKYGRLQPLKSILKGKNIYWECECDCGQMVTKRKNHLISGATTSCGCFNKEALIKRHGDANKDFVGTVFGRLTVLERAENAPDDATRWHCRCVCGEKTVVLKNSLLRGNTRSCGCLSVEKSSERIKKLIANYKGAKHPRWNPALTDEDRTARRHIPGYKEFVKEAMVRDDYTCQVCTKHGGDLAVHHLNSYSQHPEERTELSNGTTLCAGCHSAFHALHGYAEASKEDFQGWIKTNAICK